MSKRVEFRPHRCNHILDQIDPLLKRRPGLLLDLLPQRLVFNAVCPGICKRKTFHFLFCSHSW